ncbi:hypothetical protein FLL45_11920 [Aliikangiella marina]|uniref:Nuclear transport factor 2 family protein n=1 Tax=Aliikangiella marina TaxID=1712262 RepID=A0A545T8M6_9GAMM|nr:hypothetical protein [Aliikangiella marina]TQV73574.1 hypothetical protein FLL45_11920 [Aliikangiella marina]
MNKLFKTLQVVGVILLINSNMIAKAQAACDDPAAAVMRIMNCIENENAFCAASGYASNFAKYHNTLDTDTNRPGYFFWLGAFLFIDFELEFDHVVNVAENQVSMRYIETVTFNDGEVFTQYEHALVTVNNSCRMEMWDQYGDNKEQQDVDDKAATLFPF